MNDDEAKLILQCARPGGQDDHDAAIREAMEQLSANAGAMENATAQRTLDAVTGQRLRDLEPPADLRRKILAGARLSRPRPWYLRPAWLAAAAAIAVAATLALKFWPAGQAPLFAAISLSDFRTATTQLLNEGPSLEKMGNMDVVREHIAGHSRIKSVPVPENLCHCPGGAIGCAIFKISGQEVPLICFNAGRQGTVHLFTLDASALKDHPGGPIYSPVNGWHTLAWTSGNKLLLLAGSEQQSSSSDLQNLVVARH